MKWLNFVCLLVDTCLIGWHLAVLALVWDPYFRRISKFGLPIGALALICGVIYQASA